MPLPGLTLRAAALTDRAAIHSLIDEAFAGPDVAGLAMRLERTPSQVAERVERDLDWCVVADYRMRTIGHISCWQDEMLGVIGSHAVAEPYRHLGVGGALLNRMVRQARAHGLRLLEASFGAQMCRAIPMYERHGFRRIGCTSPDGWIRYERRLDGPT